MIDKNYNFQKRNGLVTGVEEKGRVKEQRRKGGLIEGPGYNDYVKSTSRTITGGAKYQKNVW